MNRQQPLALAPPAGDADWSERSLLDGATRRALVSINLAFLDLAGELAEEGRLKQIPGLPPRAIDSLIGLEAGPRLCERLPFALFDLRFADGGFWSAEIAAAGGVQDAATSPAADERIVAFTRAAIMVVWHLAQTRASGARLVFGASPATIAAIAAMPVAAVERLARRDRDRADGALRLARAVLAAVRRLRCAARPALGRPAAAARAADPGRRKRPRPVPAAAPPAERRMR